MKIKFEDFNFPFRLKSIPDAPKQLYVKGNINLLNEMGIAIIGSRTCTEYGKQVCSRFSKELSQYGINIISGMATGIDTIAHTSCLSVKGKTIAVLPCGFNNIFPKENIELFENIINSGGCIVTEYSPSTSASYNKFLKRNRIVSGLAIGTLVIEAGHRSGTTVTARLTKEQGKKVFCIPNSLNNPKGIGTNNLIKDGAFLVTCVEDILEQYKDLKFNKLEFNNTKINSNSNCFNNSNNYTDNNNNISSNYTSIITNTSNYNTINNNIVTDFSSNYNSINTKNINPEYMSIYNLLSNKPTHIDTIIRLSKLSINEVNYILTMLELENAIIQLPGKQFILRI